MHDKEILLPQELYTNHLKTIHDINFTRREIDIMACRLNGRDKGKEIASFLSLSENTIRTHLKNISAKIEGRPLLDFLENSPQYGLLKKHYLLLQIFAIFEKALKEIAKMKGELKNLSYLMVHWQNDPHNIFVQQLESDLKFLGIFILREVRETQQYFSELISEIPEGSGVIYVPSRSFIKKLQKEESISIPPSSNKCLFILPQRSVSQKSTKEFKVPLFVDFAEYKNYYFVFFEVLKRICTTLHFDATTTEFDKKYMALRDGDIFTPPPPPPSPPLPEFYKSLLLRRFFLPMIVLIGTVSVGTVYWINHMGEMETALNSVNIVSPMPINLETKHNKKYTGELASYLTISRNDHFIGRKNELKKLDDLLKKNQYVIITGESGQGKSMTALEYGYQQKLKGTIVRDFNSDTIEQLHSGYTSLAKELKINISGLGQNELMNLVHGKLGKEEVDILFIFDNIDSVESYNKIKPYLYNLPSNVKVIITSKNYNIINENKLQGKNIHLNPFNKEEVKNYLLENLKNRLSSEDLKKIEANATSNPRQLEQIATYFTNNISTTSESFLALNQKNFFHKNIDIFLNKYNKCDKDKKFAWQILQYLCLLSPDFISIDFLKELSKDSLNYKEDLESIINYLISLSIIRTRYINNCIGLTIHRETQRELQKYINSNENGKLNQNLVNDLARKLNNMMPYVTYSPDSHWNVASATYDHISTLLKNQSLNIDRKTLGDLNAKLGVYNFNVVQNYTEAIKYLDTALLLRREIYSKDNSKKNLYKIAKSLDDLGIAFHRKEYNEKSLKYFQDKLSIMQQIHQGKDHEDYAKSLDRVGMALEALDCRKGLEYCIQALKMRQRLYKNQDHPELATSLYNVGDSYQELGEIEEGVKYCTQALEMRQRLYKNQDHPELATSLDSVGYGNRHLGNFQKALDCGVQTLEMRQRIYKNQDHPSIANSLHNTAKAYNALGRTKEGLNYFKLTLEMRQRLYGKCNDRRIFWVLDDIGKTYYQLGDLIQSIMYSEQALSMAKMLENQSSYLSACLYNLGKAYYKFGDVQKGLEYMKQAYVMYKNCVTENHPEFKTLHEDLIKLSPEFIEKKENRIFIEKRGVFDKDTLKIKEKIQHTVLDKIQKSCQDGHWEDRFFTHGAKSYFREEYLENMLGSLASPKNIEISQELCFEAMNLGIMSNTKDRNYNCISNFIKNYPTLMKNIMNSHPEYFIDGSILRVGEKSTHKTLNTVLVKCFEPFFANKLTISHQ